MSLLHTHSAGVAAFMAVLSCTITTINPTFTSPTVPKYNIIQQTESKCLSLLFSSLLFSILSFFFFLFLLLLPVRFPFPFSVGGGSAAAAAAAAAI